MYKTCELVTNNKQTSARSLCGFIFNLEHNKKANTYVLSG